MTLRIALLGAAIGMLAPVGAAHATTKTTPAASAVHANARAIQAGMTSAHKSYAAGGRSVAHYSRGGLQCVPFARDNTGIELSGNASTWWHNAEGVYQRGAHPEVGSVLNFRANGRMRMGHVAVVSQVQDPRTVEIDHANWAGPGGGRGAVSRNITVVDVSPNNDWTAVRVALGHTGDFGSVYPTYGFIYDRPDVGVMVANNSTAPAPVLNAAPRDLRPASERMQATAQDAEEVAEADDESQPRARRAVHHARGGRPVVTKVHATGAAATHKAHVKHRT
jgi:surface antigen